MAASLSDQVSFGWATPSGYFAIFYTVKSIFQCVFVYECTKTHAYAVSTHTHTHTHSLTHSLTQTVLGSELVRVCEAPSAPCGPLLAKPLLISLTTLAIFSPVIINHLSSPLFPSPTSSRLFSSPPVFLSPLLCCLALHYVCVRAAVMR